MLIYLIVGNSTKNTYFKFPDNSKKENLILVGICKRYIRIVHSKITLVI